MCDKGQRQAKGVKEGRKKAKRREKEERMQEKRVKGEKTEGERKQQRKMVAPETARPHQNLRSDADGHDEMSDDPT